MLEVSQVSFNGLWEKPAKLLHEKEVGVFYRDKTYYKLRKIIYHPWKDESPEQVAEAVDKHFFGRSFSVMDTSIEDSQRKYDAYHMNYIQIGEPINKADAQKFIERGYSENFSGGILSDSDFYASYNNASYAPFDIRRMDKEDVIDFAQRHFDIKA